MRRTVEDEKGDGHRADLQGFHFRLMFNPSGTRRHQTKALILYTHATQSEVNLLFDLSEEASILFFLKLEHLFFFFFKKIDHNSLNWL